MTTVILNQATLKAPHAARAYHWRCFDHLSQPDPAIRSGTKPITDHLNPNGLQGAVIRFQQPRHLQNILLIKRPSIDEFQPLDGYIWQSIVRKQSGSSITSLQHDASLFQAILATEMQQALSQPSTNSGSCSTSQTTIDEQHTYIPMYYSHPTISQTLSSSSLSST